MTRLPRLCPSGISVHIIQHGNNRQTCFSCDKDRQTYLRFLREASEYNGVKIHAWVLMTHHVHLLATPEQDVSLSRMMPLLGTFYVAVRRQINIGFRCPDLRDSLTHRV